MRIAIAGSTGFVGGRLIEQLLANSNIQIAALSRRGVALIHPNNQGIVTDFFSLASAERALKNCEVAFYFLHSMIPSNTLSQGNFEDFDFILADNFARAAKATGVKKIVYVGGIVDENTTSISMHLRSRLEVERVLGSSGIPLTTIRCSLVIGAEGSSFQILKKLVSRLPSMFLPNWCNTPCQPVAIEDLIRVLDFTIFRHELDGICIDLGAPGLLSYRKLIELTAKAAGLKRKFMSIPFIPIQLSKLWVRLVTGASQELVYPLIDSLIHPMTVRPANKISANILPQFTPIDQALAKAISEKKIVIKLSNPGNISLPPSENAFESRLVKSVQRLSRPQNTNALKIARLYFAWLSRFFNGIINVKNNGQCAKFYLAFCQKSMLELTFSPNRSTPDRQLFYITGGFLVAKNSKGRLEFRESPTSSHVFAAIHDFKPSLPWWIYRITQAPAHRFVMWAFGKFLNRRNFRRKGWHL